MDFTAKDWGLFAAITVAAALIGMIYVARAPRRGPIAIRVLLGAPFVSGLIFSFILFVLGIASAKSGSGVLGAIRTGIGAGVCYGFGTGVYGAPGAIVGGLIGVLIWYRRQHPQKTAALRAQSHPTFPDQTAPLSVPTNPYQPPKAGKPFELRALRRPLFRVALWGTFAVTLTMFIAMLVTVILYR